MEQSELELLVWLRQALEDGSARRIRRRALTSQSEASKVAQVTPAAISLWESGDRCPRGPEGLRYARLLRRLQELTR